MLQMYAIMDKKTGSFERPFFVKHVAEATRSVQQALKQNHDSFLSQYPEDYSLWLVGSFDPSNGGIMPPNNLAPQWTIEVASLMPPPDKERNYFNSAGPVVPPNNMEVKREA